jgi:hypothetical protein
VKAVLWGAGIAAALGLLAAGEWLAPDAPAPDVAAVSAGAPAGASVALNTAGMAPQWSATMLARPLFRQDRRPVSEAVAVAGTAVVPLPRLSAIVITASGAAAIFDDGSGKPLVLRVGGAVAGYTVKQVGPGGVELDSAAGAKILRPKYEPDGGGGTVDITADAAQDPPAGPAAPAVTPPAPWRRNLDSE